MSVLLSQCPRSRKSSTIFLEKLSNFRHMSLRLTPSGRQATPPIVNCKAVSEFLKSMIRNRLLPDTYYYSEQLKRQNMCLKRNTMVFLKQFSNWKEMYSPKMRPLKVRPVHPLLARPGLTRSHLISPPPTGSVVGVVV
jgi:hypothetical protein